jgi:transcriptional regulator with XRE-family HTH domain
MELTMIVLTCDHPGCTATIPAASPAPGWRAWLCGSGPHCWGHLCPVHAEQAITAPLCSRCHERGVSQSQPYLVRRGIYSACYQQLWKTGQLPPCPPRPRATVRRDCEHKQANHQHGTYAAYVLDRCRCDACRNANVEYEHDRSQLAARRRWDPTVPATPRGELVPARRARAHLKALMAAGMGLKTIAAKSGIAHGSISAIIYGKRSRVKSERRPRRRRITRQLEQRILAVNLDLAGGAKVDPTGTARRLQALVAIGWSQSQLARRLGKTPANVTETVHGTRQTTVATAAAVRGLYDELWDSPPPETNQRERIAAARSRHYAAAHGWPPPLAWDDDTIDDPTTQPDLRDSTQTVAQQRIEDARELLTQGVSAELIAARLGTTLDALHSLSRHYAPELATPFNTAARRARPVRKAS